MEIWEVKIFFINIIRVYLNRKLYWKDLFKEFTFPISEMTAFYRNLRRRIILIKMRPYF